VVRGEISMSDAKAYIERPLHEVGILRFLNILCRVSGPLKFQRAHLFCALPYVIAGVCLFKFILFAALRRFCEMAAMTICAWVLARPK
jgi:hypothetical protein